MEKFAIESRTVDPETEIATPWDRDVGDQNEFETRAEAEAAIDELKTLGPDWEAAEYRVVPL